MTKEIRTHGPKIRDPKTRDPKDFQLDLPPRLRPARAALREEWYPEMRNAWQGCTSRRIYDSILGIRTIVIHATAGSSSDGAASVMREGRASFHWLVADENEFAHGRFVWATAPEARAAWHVRNNCSHPDVWDGRSKINHTSLGVEIVNAQSGGDAFSHWQIEATAEIVRYAWAKYPNLRHVVSHARLDPNRRTDPGANFPWEVFSQAVLTQKNNPPSGFPAAGDITIGAQ